MSDERSCSTCGGSNWIPDERDGTEVPCPSCNTEEPPRPPTDFISIVPRQADPDIPINCPYCGAALAYLRTEGETHFYSCPRHGRLMLPPDGRIRQQPS
jgi:DNA-directed RNA polymerase subunit RPC12/RpoP